MAEGSGFGSIPLTSGSGSGRPKNMGIRGSGFGSGALAGHRHQVKQPRRHRHPASGMVAFILIADYFRYRH
jgi:hypothetical protein